VANRADSRRERLAEALKENLKRRKARQRACAAPPATADKARVPVHSRPNAAPKPQ